MENTEVAVIRPATFSASGKNAYYMDGCKVVGGRPAYAACISKIEARKSGKLGASWSDCSTAIGHKDCPAQEMRQRELLEGKAIYFIDRDELLAQIEEREAVEMERVGKLIEDNGEPVKKTRQRTAPAPKAGFIDPLGGSYAAAINRALEEEGKTASVTKPVAPVVVANVAKAGMSMAEIARAALAQATV